MRNSNNNDDDYDDDDDDKDKDKDKDKDNDNNNHQIAHWCFLVPCSLEVSVFCAKRAKWQLHQIWTPKYYFSCHIGWSQVLCPKQIGVMLGYEVANIWHEFAWWQRSLNKKHSAS